MPETPQADANVLATELAKSPKTIKQLLTGPELKEALNAVLPTHLTADRFLRVAINAITRTPKLLDCTRESFFKCLMELSSYGLEPDGRRAYLIPFNNKIKGPDGKDRYAMEVTLIIGYMGLAELVRRSGDVAYLHADVVLENDEFEFHFGSNAMLHHKPHLGNRGQAIKAFYSFVKFKDGSEDFMVLGKSEVDKIRASSKSPDSPAWKNWYDEMGKKSAFRRHSKWLPLSPQIRNASESGDDAEDFNPDVALSAADYGNESEGSRESAGRAGVDGLLKIGDIEAAKKVAKDYGFDWKEYQDRIDTATAKTVVDLSKDNPSQQSARGEKAGANTTGSAESSASGQGTAEPSPAGESPAPESKVDPQKDQQLFREAKLKKFRDDLGGEDFWKVVGGAGFEEIPAAAASSQYEAMVKELDQAAADKKKASKKGGRLNL